MSAGAEFYASMGETARELISLYGSDTVFTRTIDTDYNPADGTTETCVEQYTVKAVKNSFNVDRRSDNDLKSGSVQLITLPAKFEVDDRAKVNGQTLKITAIEPIQPGAIVVAYFVTLSL